MDNTHPSTPTHALWREKLHEVIFEADTPAGKAFDVALLLVILLSVLVVSLETVEEYDSLYHGIFTTLEWLFTILFTIEYALRIVCVRRASNYIFSFFGIVDLLAILPTYLSLILPGTQSLVVIRALRLLRVFRIFKLARMLSEASALRRAVWEARGKVLVFVTTVLIVVCISGAAMYFVEDVFQRSHLPTQFTSIPQAIYWAIVTMTTVGYGDVVPQTTWGKFLSAMLIMIGYSLIIVPTGFVSAELVRSKKPSSLTTQSCPRCVAEGHDSDAKYCKYCGGPL